MSILTGEDDQFLNANDFDWELLFENNTQRGLLIKQFCIPTGYQPATVDLMILIPDNYPVAGIDMFYFSPAILRDDGKTIGSLEIESHFDRQWQRWSRHYDWHAGCCNVATHVKFVSNQLESELD